MAQKPTSTTNSFTPPRIGDFAPSFKAETTRGNINFPSDYNGKWVLFFSHPADFTPICTSEFMATASMSAKFAEANCDIVGLSCDTLRSHVEWLERINNLEYKGMTNVEVNFPLIADWKRDIANQYGMIHPEEDDTKAVRTVFLIDPEGVIRLISYYPNNIGRDVEELYRALIALQVSKKFDVYIPAGWQPGDDVIDPQAMDKTAKGEEVSKRLTPHDWFFWTKKLSKKKVMDALGERRLMR